MSNLITVKEAAKILKRCPSFVYDRIRTDEISSTRNVAGRYRVFRDEISKLKKAGYKYNAKLKLKDTETIKILETSRGKVRFINEIRAYVLSDVARACSMKDSYTVSRRPESNSIWKIQGAESIKYGLSNPRRGTIVATMKGIEEYKSKARIENKYKIHELLKELRDLTPSEVKLEEPSNKLALLTGNFMEKPLTIYGTKEEPLFLAKEVAEIIEHSDVSMMLKNIDEEEKDTRIVCTLGGNQAMSMLTEYGLYEVLMTSRKPIAKEFKKCVKGILKSIRTAGGYVANSEKYLNNLHMLPQDIKEMVKQAIEDKKSKIEAEQQRLEQEKLKLEQIL